MPTLILAESSLEIVPKELQNHASVTSYCKKNGKSPSDVLLDNSWHFAAMKGIKNEIKRGRPDIVHLTLLSVCNTPLYNANKFFDKFYYYLVRHPTRHNFHTKSYQYDHGYE